MALLARGDACRRMTSAVWIRSFSFSRPGPSTITRWPSIILTQRQFSSVYDQADTMSARSLFKQTPVDPSIFKYIQTVGIGKPKRSTKRKRRKPFSRDKAKASGHGRLLLSTDEEQERFHEARRRQPSTSAPPPPFPSPSTTKHHKKNYMAASQPGRVVVQQFPVKILGSVGRQDAPFPKATPNLPEVAIAGRSNVGKSTLLNALLYGSALDPAAEDKGARKFVGSGIGSGSGSGSGGVRPKQKKTSSQTAKLPPGLKAATSSKPGQTRTLTFYQLSAKVAVSSSSNGDHGDNEEDDHDDDEGQPDRMYDVSNSNSSSSPTTKKVSLLLVDLPGYGFAFASEPQAQEWHSLMQSYLLGRGKSLKRILWLVDSRHGMKKADLDFLETLQDALALIGVAEEEEEEEKHNNFRTTPKPRIQGSPVVAAASNDRVPNNKQKQQQGQGHPKQKQQQGRRRRRELPPIQLVLTKCDLVSQSDLARRVVLVRKQLSDVLRRQPSALPIMLTSAQVEGQAGVLELQKELASLVPIHASN